MGYRSKKYKKKGFYKKSKGQKLTTVNTVKKMLGKKLEHKISDVSFNGTYGQSAQITLINGLNQGANQSNRIGNEFIMKHLEIRLEMIVADTTNVCRILVVLDRQANNAAFIQTDLFQVNNDPFSFINEDNKKRFKIIYDKTYATSTNWRPVVSIHKYINLKNIVTYCNGTTSAIGNIKTNALFFVMLSDSAVGPNPTFYGYSRLTYTDS